MQDADLHVEVTVIAINGKADNSDTSTVNVGPIPVDSDKWPAEPKEVHFGQGFIGELYNCTITAENSSIYSIDFGKQPYPSVLHHPNALPPTWDFGGERADRPQVAFVETSLALNTGGFAIGRASIDCKSSFLLAAKIMFEDPPGDQLKEEYAIFSWPGAYELYLVRQTKEKGSRLTLAGKSSPDRKDPVEIRDIKWERGTWYTVGAALIKGASGHAQMVIFVTDGTGMFLHEFDKGACSSPGSTRGPSICVLGPGQVSVHVPIRSSQTPYSDVI